VKTRCRGSAPDEENTAPARTEARAWTRSPRPSQSSGDHKELQAAIHRSRASLHRSKATLDRLEASLERNVLSEEAFLESIRSSTNGHVAFGRLDGGRPLT
jgi:hypothetical protein